MAKPSAISSIRALASCVAIALTLTAAARAARADDGSELSRLVESPQRSEANRVRDPYRHPLEVLRFFGVPSTATVVEILPGGGGYWTEILAPYLRDHGRYIAANPPADTASAEAQRDNAAFAAKMAGSPASYGKVEVAAFAPGTDIALPASADFVLTFRNIHNWMAAGTADQAFKTFYRVLKPGGILGVEEHRGRTDQPQDPKAASGYVREDYAIALAKAAGFVLAGTSEINANPKDTKDYPVGVWALPPTYRLKDQDRAKYAAIGESDRFVLKFVKPADAKAP